MNLKEKTVVIDNKTYHYSKIIMLPSLNFSKIGKFKDTGNLVFNNSNLDIPRGEFQHLYFLSTDKICEGDWFLMNGCIERQCKSIEDYLIVDTTGGKHHNSVCQKIISSSNPKLNLPKPSEQFLQIYINCFNKNEKIDECLVEYELNEKLGIKQCLQGLNSVPTAYVPKIAKGEITIRIFNLSYSKSDFMNALHKVELKHNKDYSKLWEEIEQNL